MTSPQGLPGSVQAASSADRDFTPAIYGSLLVTTLIAVQWWHDISTTRLGLSLIIAVCVFWLTYVWSGIVNRRVHGPISRSEGMSIAVVEAPMLVAAIVPTVILALGSLGLATVDTAIGIALFASVAQLFLWGLAVGRAAHAGWPLALRVAVVDCFLGLAIVVLKVIVIH